MNPRPIITTFIHPSIIERPADWIAARSPHAFDAPIGNGRTEREAISDLLDREDAVKTTALATTDAPAGKFRIGDRVRKHGGSWWEGRVVGTYSTRQTPEGYAVQMDMVRDGPVQIYPAAALEASPAAEHPDDTALDRSIGTAFPEDTP